MFRTVSLNQFITWIIHFIISIQIFLSQSLTSESSTQPHLDSFHNYSLTIYTDTISATSKSYSLTSNFIRKYNFLTSNYLHIWYFTYQSSHGTPLDPFSSTSTLLYTIMQTQQVPFMITYYHSTIPTTPCTNGVTIHCLVEILVSTLSQTFIKIRLFPLGINCHHTFHLSNILSHSSCSPITTIRLTLAL